MQEKNEVATKEIKPIAVSGGLALQNQLLAELEKAGEETGQKFTEYGTRCVINAIAGLVLFTKQMGIEIKNIDSTQLKLALQNIGYTELNYSAIPSEIYFDLRKALRERDGKKEMYYIPAIKPQGAGNEKLTRKYGVGLIKNTGLKNPWLVREGDDFTMPSFNGLEMTPPTWKPKLGNTGKVILVVYPAVKTDGTVEFLMADRDSVKANLIAQIRQNSMYKFKTEYNGTNGKTYEKVDTDARDKFYAELDKESATMSVDDMLNCKKYDEYINPTYISGGSKEQMIIRKMKNNALKNYPKEYDNTFISNAVQNMFEENDESVLEDAPVKRKDVVKQVEKEISETNTGEPVKDFEVDNEKAVDAEFHEIEEEKKEDATSTKSEFQENDDYGF